MGKAEVHVFSATVTSPGAIAGHPSWLAVVPAVGAGAAALFPRAVCLLETVPEAGGLLLQGGNLLRPLLPESLLKKCDVVVVHRPGQLPKLCGLALVPLHPVEPMAALERDQLDDANV